MPPFDWLREYGHMWKPGDTAIWLAPSTPDELASWYTQYRPGQLGIKEEPGPYGGVVRIDIVSFTKVPYAGLVKDISTPDGPVYVPHRTNPTFGNSAYNNALGG